MNIGKINDCFALLCLGHFSLHKIGNVMSFRLIRIFGNRIFFQRESYKSASKFILLWWWICTLTSVCFKSYVKLLWWRNDGSLNFIVELIHWLANLSEVIFPPVHNYNRRNSSWEVFFLFLFKTIFHAKSNDYLKIIHSI